MALNIDPVSSVLESGGKLVETVAGVFTENAEKSAQRSADEQKALLEAYQAEFNNRENRTWVDAIADSFNRLVRPVLVTIIIFIFIIAYISPEHFAQISLAMGSIPTGYWALLSVIVGFYFGGRMQLKSQDFQLKQSQVNAVKTLIETKKEFRKLEMDNDEPDRVLGDSLGKNDDVEVLRQGHVNGVVKAFKSVEGQAQMQEKLRDTVEKVKAKNDPTNPGLFDFEVGG